MENKKNLITAILKMMKMHKISSIRIYTNKKNNHKGTSCAYALSLFLKNVCNLDAEVVISDPTLHRKGITTLTKPDVENFIALLVDCQKIDEIENDTWTLSPICVQIYASAAIKGWTVINFVEKNSSSTAELLYHHFIDYLKDSHQKLQPEIAKLLYVSLIAATKHFTHNIKGKTFETARELLNLGADYHYAAYVIDKKKRTCLSAIQVILRNMVDEHNNYAYAKISKEEQAGLTIDDFQNALDLIKHIEDIYVWALFLESPRETYTVCLQSCLPTYFDVSTVSRKNNGDGEDESFSTALIQEFDFEKVIDDIELMIKKGRTMMDQPMFMEQLNPVSFPDCPSYTA